MGSIPVEETEVFYLPYSLYTKHFIFLFLGTVSQILILAKTKGVWYFLFQEFPRFFSDAFQARFRISLARSNVQIVWIEKKIAPPPQKKSVPRGKRIGSPAREEKMYRGTKGEDHRGRENPGPFSFPLSLLFPRARSLSRPWRSEHMEQASVSCVTQKRQ